MAREKKSTESPRTKAGVELAILGEAGIVSVSGLIDENFVGFGAIGSAVKSLIINVSGMTRMTSFGVRQWLKAMDALPKTLGETYLLGCPTFFVDQLNMVLNFGGSGKVLTVVAPYTCPSCGQESGETVDVLADRSTLAKGGVPEKECARCSGKLEFDETPESYFSFVTKYAASNIQPPAAQLLGSMGLYTALDSAGDKPPRIIKLVHGPVTYFRIIGTIGAMFRARPFLVGAEGEVVIDLAEVDRFDVLGQREWRRLLKSLAGQVPAVTLVDVTDSFLATCGDSLSSARNIFVSSVLVPYLCSDCGRVAAESHALDGAIWPLKPAEQVCSTCGGTRHSAMRPESLIPLQKASTSVPANSEKLIGNRKEVLSRALTDANVAQAGEGASATLNSESTILGKYKIVRRLSAGGMAEVFLAKQVGIGGFEKPVALKRILRQLLESRHLAVDMFLNEAKIAGRLMHPNIVQVLDVGEESGALFLAMEYVHGRDLREVLKKLRSNRERMPLAEACFIVREISQALHHAYWSTDLAGQQLSVVHRDVSPHNVILGYDGTVKLLDFGVAMSAVTEHAETVIAGKWAYMSPEHTTNLAVDHRSDLFSVGVMMYLLCTGNMPFGGTEPREIVRKIRAGAYKPVREAAPDVPEGVANLIARLLAPAPEDRPQTGLEVVNTLSEIVRTYKLESSGASITAALSQLYPTGAEENVVKGIVRAPGQEDWGGATRRMPVGSDGSQPQPDSPSSFNRGMTPSGPWGIDASVSLARRPSHEFSTPKRISEAMPVPPQQPQPPPPQQQQQQLPPPPPVPLPVLSKPISSTVRVVLTVAVILAIVLAMYLFVPR